MGAVGDQLLLVALPVLHLTVPLGNAETGPVTRGAGRPTVRTSIMALDAPAFVLGIRVIFVGLANAAITRIMRFVLTISLYKQWLLRNSSLAWWQLRG
jgi:hypothetical protein